MTALLDFRGQITAFLLLHQFLESFSTFQCEMDVMQYSVAIVIHEKTPSVKQETPLHKKLNFRYTFKFEWFP